VIPRVSVIIPAYNSEATIRGCLKSIEQQSLRDCEIIVVDSSPTDEAARIVRDEFPAVHLIRSESRLYPQEARSRGVEVARGDLLVFTDSHTYAHHRWLELERSPATARDSSIRACTSASSANGSPPASGGRRTWVPLQTSW
jgi:glycosyltransferase involved in cell wall biosynthesis